VSAISVPSDPTLLSTPTIVATDRASGSVFILPAVLLGAFVVLLLVVLLRRRAKARTDNNEPVVRPDQVGGV
jgi:hypothetical protein